MRICSVDEFILLYDPYLYPIYKYLIFEHDFHHSRPKTYVEHCKPHLFIFKELFEGQKSVGHRRSHKLVYKEYFKSIDLENKIGNCYSIFSFQRFEDVAILSNQPSDH